MLDRTKVLYGPWTQTYGETNYFKKKVLDRTKVLHGPRTQTYGETNYFEKNYKFWTEPRSCMVLGLKPIGKPTTLRKYKFWTKPRSCIVLGLKPMGKLVTKKI